MRHAALVPAFVVTTLVILAGHRSAVDADNRGGNGPDVTCSRVALTSIGDGDNIFYYGQADGMSAFSMASTSCNIGNQPADWRTGNARNPVIAQNLYRVAQDGSAIEQIGMSWVKHSFCAVDEFTCGDCQANVDCRWLAVGCADTYGAGTNGDPSSVGPRWEINPQGVGPGGVHGTSHGSPVGNAVLKGRLQIKHTDIIAGDSYLAEIQYVTHDEDLDARWNNASYRPMNLTTTSLSGAAPGQASVRFGEPAIFGWREINPAVTIVAFEDDPGFGRYHLGYLVTDNGDGTWTYEYALHNLNSDRAANRFSVDVPVGVNLSNMGFHDIDYHSGDGWNGAQNFDDADWAVTVGSGAVAWSCADFTTDPNANALRWGTLYNYRFTADTPPVPGTATVGMYKAGGRDTVNVAVLVPDEPDLSCPADIASNGGPASDGVVDVFDLLALLAGWGTNGPGADIAEPADGIVDVFDLLALLEAWGGC